MGLDNFCRRSGVYYVLLKFTEYKYPHISWSVVIVGIIIYVVVGIVKGKRSKVISHFVRIHIYVWCAFNLLYIVFCYALSNWGLK